MSATRPEFYLRLTGDDISPENARIETLYGVLSALERAIEAMSTELGIEFDEHEAIIIPSAPEASSLGLPGRVNHKAVSPLQHIDRAFYHAETEMLPASVAAEISEMQGTLAPRGLTASIESDDMGLHGVTVTEDTPDISTSEDDELSPMTSHAVVYGICTRVNRDYRDATVRLHDDSICRVKELSDAQFQLLMSKAGDDLDQVFRLEGPAKWHVDDYRIFEIAPSDIQPVTRDAGALFDELAEVVGDDFEAITADFENIDVRGVLESPPGQPDLPNI